MHETEAPVNFQMAEGYAHRFLRLKVRRRLGPEIPDSHFAYKRGDYKSEEIFSWGPCVESLIKRQIEVLLATNTDRPVIALDIGGMIGLSWSRLALDFQDQVASGKLALVVSSLVDDSGNNGRLLPGLTDEEQAVIQRAKSLVARIYGDAESMIGQSIVLGNGQQLGLFGNVSLMHDRWSLVYWSELPELEVVQAGTLLAQDGIWISQADGKTGLYSTIKDDVASMENEEQRRQGARLAFRFLADYYSLSPDPFYFGTDEPRIYRMPQAPRIEI